MMFEILLYVNMYLIFFHLVQKHLYFGTWNIRAFFLTHDLDNKAVQNTIQTGLVRVGPKREKCSLNWVRKVFKFCFHLQLSLWAVTWLIGVAFKILQLFQCKSLVRNPQIQSYFFSITVDFKKKLQDHNNVYSSKW